MYTPPSPGLPVTGYPPNPNSSEYLLSPTMNNINATHIPPPPPERPHMPFAGHAPLTLNASMVGNNQTEENPSSSAPSAPQSLPSTPQNSSSTQPHPLRPGFQPPAPGQLTVAQATITAGGYRRSVPVLYYTSTNGENKYVYPFTRTLIGTVWYTPEHLNRCEIQHVHEPDTIKFCARRADLPVEMIQQLLVSLEQNGGGANLDTAKLVEWQNDVRNPEGKFSAGIPCMQCGILNNVRLCDVLYLRDISNGMTCHHMGKDCIREDVGMIPSHNNCRQPFTRHQQTSYLPNESSLLQPQSFPAMNNGPYTHQQQHMRSSFQLPNWWNNSGPNNDFGYPLRMAPQAAWVDPRLRTNPSASMLPNPPALEHRDLTGRQVGGAESFQPQQILHPYANQRPYHHQQAPSRPQETMPKVTQFQSSLPEHRPSATMQQDFVSPQQTPSGFFHDNPFVKNQPPNQNMETMPNRIGVRPHYKPDSSSVMLTDEVIQPGEELHKDTDTPMNDPSIFQGEISNIPHPSMLVRGRVLRTFTTQPPSITERQELQCMKEENKLERLNTILSKKLSDRTIPTFKGDSDNVQAYSQWEAALLKHFYASNITNSAIRAWLAQNTFADAANVWWVAHQSRRPLTTFSWTQMRELIQAELVPSVEKGSINAAWADLVFDGQLNTFFEKVRTMSLYHPLPPKELQIMSSRPFGSAFVDRVKGSVAQNGTRGLTVPQWEAMVRAYVKEQESHPNFQAWGRGGLEPIHRTQPRLRQTCVDAHEEPSVLEDVPPNMDEEEWVTHVAHLFSSVATSPAGGKPLRIGKGPRPCFVCGKDSHSWVRCERRRRGKCGVCGSDSHYTRFCAQRYYPDPKLAANPVPKDAPTPSARCVQTRDDDLPQHVSTPAIVSDEAPTTTPITGVTNETSCNFTPSNQDIVTPIPLATDSMFEAQIEPVPNSWPSIRQVKIDNAEDLALPLWLKHRLRDGTTRSKVGRPIIPTNNPNETGQLHYNVTIEGVQAKMLYDPGASHCFMDWNWADKHGIRVRPRPSSSLNMFQGTALGAIKWSYIANDFVLGDASYVWRFLVIKPAPADIVLGLDFILHHKPIFDPLTLRLWPTTPNPQKSTNHEPPNEPHQEGLENHWVTTYDAIQSRHLNAVNVTYMNQHAPIALSTNSMFLFSVTADSMEEERQLQDFYQTLDSELLTVVRQFDEVFAPPDKEPPNRETKHPIKLVKDAVPIKRRPYPLPEHKIKAMKEQISELDANGWIEKSISPWGAPILFVPKKNGDLRMCVDFRDLNAMTEDDSFPLPRIEVLLHRASSAKLFSKLDLASGFHQIEVQPDARPLTAFRLPEPVNGSSLWQWKVMPFGLRNAPPTFQRAMTEALRGLDHCAVVYIDDILIFSQTKEEHLQHLRMVFEALKRHQYHIRLPKCEFLKEEVEFLGHKLNQKGISTQAEKVDSLQGWVTPFTTSKQIKSFLGAAAWYQSFIPHFATMAAPLYALTSTKRKFLWNDDCERAVQCIKDALQKAPVLARWQPNKATRVITDASKVGIGATLEQLHEKGWQPISFWSRKLKPAELNYSATDLEWLAVVMCVTRV